MAYFDYNLPASGLDLSTGLSSVGDALTDVLNRRQKQRQVDAQLAMDKTQQDINLRKSREDTLRFRRDQQKDRTALTTQAMGEIQKGNPQGAAALMHGYTEYDPETGNPIGQGELVQGKAADVGPAPVAPVAPQSPQGLPPEIAARRRGRTSTSDEAGYVSKGRPAGSYESVDPLRPPADPFAERLVTHEYNPETQAARFQDTSDMVREEQARMDAEKYGTDKAAYDKAAGDFPGQQLAFNEKKRQAEAERPYTMKFGPNDPGVTVDVASQRDRLRKERADQFLASFDGLQLSPKEQEAVRAAHGYVASGGDPKTAMQMFREQRLLGEKQEGSSDLQSQRDAAALERAKIAGPRADGNLAVKIGQLHEGQARGAAQDIDRVNRSIDQFATKFGEATKEHRSYVALDSAVKNLESNNPTQQREGASALVRFFRGGNMVTSDAYKNILGRVTGLGGRIEDALTGLESGQFGDQKVTTLREAARSAVDQYKGQLREFEQGARNAFGPGSGYENYGGNVNARVGGLFQTLGMPIQPIYPEAPPPVQLGERARPYKEPAKKKRSGGAPPEVRAKDNAKASSALDEAMQ